MLVFRPREVVAREARLASLARSVEECVWEEGRGLGRVLSEFSDKDHQAYLLGRAYLDCLEAEHDSLVFDVDAATAYQEGLEALLGLAQQGQEAGFLAYVHALSLVAPMLPADYLVEMMTEVLEAAKPEAQLLMELLTVCDGEEELRFFEGRVYREATRRFPAEFGDWYGGA